MWVARNWRRPGPSQAMFTNLGSTVGLHAYCVLFLLQYPSLYFLFSPRSPHIHSRAHFPLFSHQLNITSSDESLRFLAPFSTTICKMDIVYQALWCSGYWWTLSSLLQSGNSLTTETLFYSPLYPQSLPDCQAVRVMSAGICIEMSVIILSISWMV